MAKQNLPITDLSAISSTGCACCSPTGTAGPAEATSISADAASTAGVVSTYGVTGMTCGHCIGAVTRGISALGGVHDVDVSLVAGGTSAVTITSAGQLDDDAVGDAITEAGYALTGRTR